MVRARKNKRTILVANVIPTRILINANTIHNLDLRLCKIRISDLRRNSLSTLVQLVLPTLVVRLGHLPVKQDSGTDTEYRRQLPRPTMFP